MMSIYIWIILDFVCNIFWLIFAVKAAENVMPMVVYLPATLKVIIGIEQIWLMIELNVQINRASRILSYSEEDDENDSDEMSEFDLDDQSAVDREIKLIGRGRVIVTALNCTYLLVIVILC